MKKFFIADPTIYECMDCNSLICTTDQDEFEANKYEGKTIVAVEKKFYDTLEKQVSDLKKIIAKEIGENDEFGSEFVIAGILRAENLKLRQLILLVDPAVSNEQMNELSAKQWSEFIRWQEAEGYNANN